MNPSVKALTDILEDIGLSYEESVLFMKASLFPGLTPSQLRFQCGFSRMTAYRILKRLGQQGYLFIRKEEDPKRRIYALPLDQLSKKLTSISERLLDRASEIKLLHKLAQVHKNEHEFQCEEFENEKAKEIFFDVHHQDWSMNLAVGDGESFLERFQVNDQKKWVHERIKRGRPAKGVVTTIGPYTNEIISTNEEQLRKTAYAKNLMTNHWIEIFPDIDTTFIFTPQDKNLTMLKIHSKPVTDSYSQLVRSYLP